MEVSEVPGIVASRGEGLGSERASDQRPTGRDFMRSAPTPVRNSLATAVGQDWCANGIREHMFLWNDIIARQNRPLPVPGCMP